MRTDGIYQSEILDLIRATRATIPHNTGFGIFLLNLCRIDSCNKNANNAQMEFLDTSSHTSDLRTSLQLHLTGKSCDFTPTWKVKSCSKVPANNVSRFEEKLKLM